MKRCETLSTFAVFDKSFSEWWKSDGVSHYGITSGLNISLCDNLVLRPEYRTQWAPFDAEDEMFGFDLVLTY
ncbi:MAG: hypothetical protein AAF483_29585 [Planctomycetota bacterium]